jgi:hypothetical protein
MEQAIRDRRVSWLLRVALVVMASAALCLGGLARTALAAEKVSVTLDLNGVAGEVQTIEGDGEVTMPDVSANFPGYELTGWNTKYDGTGTGVKAGDKVTTSETLYAQWKDGTVNPAYKAGTPSNTNGQGHQGTTTNPTAPSTATGDSDKKAGDQADSKDEVSNGTNVTAASPSDGADSADSMASTTASSNDTASSNGSGQVKVGTLPQLGGSAISLVFLFAGCIVGGEFVAHKIWG